jgi:formimidoylglutamate deiminase
MATGKTLRSIDCAWLLTPRGWKSQQRLWLDDAGIIVSIEPTDARAADQRLEGWVLPGMCNAHSHAHQRLLAGLTAWREEGRSSFWSWRQQMYRAIERLSVEDLEWVARYLYAELLEGGYTSIGEFHYAHRLGGCDPLESSMGLIRAADRSGCALTLLPVWYRYAGFGRKPLEPEQRAFTMQGEEVLALLADLDPQRRASDTLELGLAPHSLRAVDLDELAVLLERAPTGPIHLHIAEQVAEVEACQAHFSRRPIELLFDRLQPGPNWSLIHATHASATELDRMAEAGVVVVVCPSTEADLGDGVFPAIDWLAKDGAMAIGSDSHVKTSAAGELRLLEWTQRLVSGQRNCLLGEQARHLGTALWSRAAEQGANALGQNAGRLDVGRRADLIELDHRHPLLTALSPELAVDSFLMAEKRGMIRSVWVAGRCRVVDGQHPDRQSLSDAFSIIRARLFAENCS